MIRPFRNVAVLLFLVALIAMPIAPVAYAQTAVQSVQVIDIPAALASIEAKVESRRKELGIPGVSLVIAKDDKVIYVKGLGVKDFD